MQTRIGIIMNGVTGRMGLNQHLIRSILAIRKQGGLALRDGTILMPDPILLGRNELKLKAIADAHGLTRWSTDLDRALDSKEDSIYFDSGTTGMREGNVLKAIHAGKHVYCEKPLATITKSALNMAVEAARAGVKQGVVQDKLFLPGIRKLRRLVDSGFFGRILSVRGEFGYWVFEGDWQPSQRPSWNYRKEDDGGIILDMFCHWRYVLDHTFAPVRAVSCIGATHIPERVDEEGKRYACTADDSAYGSFELEGGIIAQINSSWTTRVYRDELFSLHVDGTEGSAVAGLRECRVQHRVNTPRPTWNPDLPNPFRFRENWQDVPDNGEFENAFKVQWEMFLRHVAMDTPFPHSFVEGARGVQLAEIGLQSWAERRWLDVPPIDEALVLKP
jgi:predicted dehydrogenase